MRTLIASGESDPVIPEAQQRRCLRILNDVNRHVKVMRRFDGRMNNLRLFDDFVHPTGRVLNRSIPEHADHPMVQLLLQRRDRYEAITRDIARYEKVLENSGDFEGKGNAIGWLCKLKVQGSRELEAMEITMIAIRKEMNVHLHTCQKFVTDVIKISQLERLLSKKLGGNLSDQSDELIDAEIAKGVDDA